MLARCLRLGKCNVKTALLYLIPILTMKETIMTNHKLPSRLLSVAFLSLTSVAAVSAHAASEAAKPPGVFSANTDDAAITARVKAALIQDPQVQSLSINVATEKGVVILSGIVPNAEVGKHVLQLAAQVPGIKKVESQLKLRPG